MNEGSSSETSQSQSQPQQDESSSQPASSLPSSSSSSSSESISSSTPSPPSPSSAPLLPNIFSQHLTPLDPDISNKPVDIQQNQTFLSTQGLAPILTHRWTNQFPSHVTPSSEELSASLLQATTLPSLSSSSTNTSALTTASSNSIPPSLQSWSLFQVPEDMNRDSLSPRSREYQNSFGRGPQTLYFPAGGGALSRDSEFVNNNSSTDGTSSKANQLNAKRGRKDSHNATEQRRRNNIKEKLDELKKLVPNCDNEKKAAILQKSIEYIHHLEQQLNELKNESTTLSQKFEEYVQQASHKKQKT